MKNLVLISVLVTVTNSTIMALMGFWWVYIIIISVILFFICLDVLIEINRPLE